MILVVGSTGLLGSRICAGLRALDLPVRALVRPGSTSTVPLRELGVQLFEGDIRRRASLDAACKGVDTVFTTATAMGSKDPGLKLRDVDLDGQLSLVAASVAAKVGRYVYVSASPNLTTGPLISYKREVERAVRASGMRWTILQPSSFMEVWLAPFLGWDYAARRVQIFGKGVAPMSYVSIDDVAAVAVRSIQDARLENRDVPVGGPQPVTPNEALAIFERVTGLRFAARRIPRPVLALLGPVVSLLDEGIGSGMALGAQAARGDVIDSSLQRELGLPSTTVEQYAKRVTAT